MAKEDKKHPPILVFASDILFASIIASTVCFCQLDTRHAIFDLFKRTLAGGPRGPKCSCLVIGIFCGFLCSECFAIFFVWSKNAECTMIGLDATSRQSVFDTCGLVESLNNPLGPTHWGDEDNMENNDKKMRKKLLPNDNDSDYDTITIIIVPDPCGGQSGHPNTANVNLSIFCGKWCFATKTMHCNIFWQKPLNFISPVSVSENHMII